MNKNEQPPWANEEIPIGTELGSDEQKEETIQKLQEKIEIEEGLINHYRRKGSSGSAEKIQKHIDKKNKLLRKKLKLEKPQADLFE